MALFIQAELKEERKCIVHIDEAKGGREMALFIQEEFRDKRKCHGSHRRN